MHLPNSSPFKHPFFDDTDEDKFVQINESEEIPENGHHFEGVGVLLGHDRPTMTSGHGEKSGGWPIIPLKQTRG